MNKLVKTGLGVGIVAGSFFAGNFAPKVRETTPRQERVVADSNEIAKNCGQTALNDVLNHDFNKDLSRAQLQTEAQSFVDAQTAQCIRDNVLGPVVVATGAEQAPTPKVEVDVILHNGNS